MKYLVLSDLHADFNFELHQSKIKDDYTDEEAESTFQTWWDLKKFPQTDGLITAGDISNDYRSFKQFITFISKKYKNVILTLGNHDLVIKGGTSSKSNMEFKTSEQKIEKMKQFCSKFDNVHLLEGDTFENISGCMGFCDFKAMSNPLLEGRLPLMWKDWFDGSYWNYFNQVPKDIWNHYDKMMMDLVKKQPKVMITHFCPEELGLSWKYRNNSYNPMFYFQGKKYLDEMADGSYWICGHIHTFATNYEYVNAKGNKITIMARPHGYPGESSLMGFEWNDNTKEYHNKIYTMDDCIIDL